MSTNKFNTILVIVGIFGSLLLLIFFSITLQKNKEREIIEMQKNKEIQVLREKQKIQEQQKREEDRLKQEKEDDLDLCLGLAASTYNEQWNSKCKDVYDVQMKFYKKCQTELSEMPLESPRIGDHLNRVTKATECENLFPKPTPLEQDGGCTLRKDIAEPINKYYSDLKDECYKRYQ